MVNKNTIQVQDHCWKQKNTENPFTPFLVKEALFIEQDSFLIF